MKVENGNARNRKVQMLQTQSLLHRGANLSVEDGLIFLKWVFLVVARGEIPKYHREVSGIAVARYYGQEFAVGAEYGERRETHLGAQNGLL